MKIYVKDGKIYCTLEEKNSKFLDAVYGFFAGFTEEGDLRSKFSLSEYLNAPIDTTEGEIDCVVAYMDFYDFAFYARYFRIEGWELANEILTQIRPKYDIIRKKREEEAKKIDKEKVWNYVQKNGCGKCAYLTYDVDVPICSYAERRLKDEPKGTYSASGKCYLMYGDNTVYPCEECLHNPKNEEKSEEKND